MKYKIENIQEKAEFEYSAEYGILSINGAPIEDPTDESIIEFDIGEEEKALGITRCYRDNDNVICHIIKYVEDLEPYKNYTFKNGEPSTQKSKWDLSKLMTAEEVINGNIQEVIDA